MMKIRCQIPQGKVKIVTIFGVRKDSSFMQGKCNGNRLGLRQQSLVNSFTYYILVIQHLGSSSDSSLNKILCGVVLSSQAF